MKMLIIIFLSCFLLTGCGQSPPSSAHQSEESQTHSEIPVSNYMNAIYYNGQCYYGLVMGYGEESVADFPENTEYIGKIASNTSPYVSPAEEMSTNCWYVGEDIYHFTDEEGKHYFYSLADKTGTYWVMCAATTEKPETYDIEK